MQMFLQFSCTGVIKSLFMNLEGRKKERKDMRSNWTILLLSSENNKRPASHSWPEYQLTPQQGTYQRAIRELGRFSQKDVYLGMACLWGSALLSGRHLEMNRLWWIDYFLWSVFLWLLFKVLTRVSHRWTFWSIEVNWLCSKVMSSAKLRMAHAIQMQGDRKHPAFNNIGTHIVFSRSVYLVWYNMVCKEV